MKSVVPHVNLGDILRGVLPIWMMIVAVAIPIAFSQIALLLPNTMMN